MLALLNHLAEPVMIYPVGWSTKLWKRYRDLGATHLRMDDALWINILDLTPATTYNGILNLQTPLCNVLQNGHKALLCFTDSDFLSIYAKLLGLSPEEYTVVVSPGHDEIKSFIDLHSDIQTLLLRQLRYRK